MRAVEAGAPFAFLQAPCLAPALAPSLDVGLELSGGCGRRGPEIRDGHDGCLLGSYKPSGTPEQASARREAVMRAPFNESKPELLFWYAWGVVTGIVIAGFLKAVHLS